MIKTGDRLSCVLPTASAELGEREIVESRLNCAPLQGNEPVATIRYGHRFPTGSQAEATWCICVF